MEQSLNKVTGLKYENKIGEVKTTYSKMLLKPKLTTDEKEETVITNVILTERKCEKAMIRIREVD